MAIGLENLYGRVNWALGIEGEGFCEGMYCIRPERTADDQLVSGGSAR
jgi:hypothetical protein